MANNLSFYENLLISKFKDLPGWARTLAYFMVLTASLYLSLLPSFISGECVIKEANGAEIPFRGEYIKMNISGQTIKVKINEEGVWSLPVVSKLPQDIHVYFLFDGKQYDVVLSWFSIWSPKMLKVYFDESKPEFKVAQGGFAENVNFVADQLKRLIPDLVSTAYAGTIDGILQDNTPTQAPKKKPIAEIVKMVIGRSIKRDISYISDRTIIQKELTNNAIDRIRLIENLQKEFNLQISDEQWDTFFTVGDLNAFIESKTDPEREQPYFSEIGELRYICNQDGQYQITLQYLTVGNVTSWTPCFEGNPLPNVPNRCNENFAVKTWIVNLRKGSQLAIWKRENGNAGGETMIVKGAHTQKNILIWKSDHGFTVELRVTKV